MERRSLVVKTEGDSRRRNWPRQIVPFFRIIGYDVRAWEIVGRSARRWRRWARRKRRNEKPVNPLKTNDSAKSSDFAPNDSRGVPFRFVSLGEMFASFGAVKRLRRAPHRFMRKEIF
jgi:hypothetical protein